MRGCGCELKSRRVWVWVDVWDRVARLMRAREERVLFRKNMAVWVSEKTGRVDRRRTM